MNDRHPLRIIHTESSLGWGGQEIRILTEAEGMRARGHVLEIWAAPGSNILPEAQKRGLTARVLPIARKTVRGILALRRALRDARPDVINTHSSTDAWLIALARLTLRDAPPVVRTRHISAPVPKNAATRWLYMHATRHVVTTGERLRETLIRSNGYRRDRITSIPTGIDIARFCAGDKDNVRRELLLDTRFRYVGIVATLRSWKGHLHLLDALSLLSNENDGVRLLIVGDGPMRSVLEARAAELKLAGHVVFAGRQDAPERWLQAMDVFCLPSYANEGVPQALLQAMATTLPVVTTPVGSITEVVEHEKNGLLVKSKDPAELAAAIKRLLCDPALSARLAEAAAVEVRQRFRFDTMLDRMERLFYEVVGLHARRRRGIRAHIARWGRSARKHSRELFLPRGYVRLGTRYGGWWLNRRILGSNPLLIDCGLGRDISFPIAFLAKFGGKVVGIDPNPHSLAYCRAHCPQNMEIWDNAFWTRAGSEVNFYLPRLQEQLPVGADGVSGSLVGTHSYVKGGETRLVKTTSLEDVLKKTGYRECDVLKLDIEGGEYELIIHLCETGEIKKVKQLLVEFHHRITHHDIDETKRMIACLEHHGFQLAHTEDRNFIFRRCDIG